MNFEEFLEHVFLVGFLQEFLGISRNSGGRALGLPFSNAVFDKTTGHFNPAGPQWKTASDG